MAQALALQLARSQIDKIAKGDAEATKQIERLIQLVNFTGWGQSLTEADETLDTTGRTFAVTLPAGRFFVDLLLMLDVVGGGGADGFAVTDVTTATVGAGFYAVDTIAVARPGPYVTVGTADAVVSLRGFIDVQQTGVVGFNVAVTGAPASVTLRAGSGLTTNIQRGPPLA